LLLRACKHQGSGSRPTVWEAHTHPGDGDTDSTLGGHKPVRHTPGGAHLGQSSLDIPHAALTSRASPSGSPAGRAALTPSHLPNGMVPAHPRTGHWGLRILAGLLQAGQQLLCGLGVPRTQGGHQEVCVIEQQDVVLAVFLGHRQDILPPLAHEHSWRQGRGLSGRQEHDLHSGLFLPHSSGAHRILFHVKGQEVSRVGEACGLLAYVTLA
jgi:hypothetical protein